MLPNRSRGPVPRDFATLSRFEQSVAQEAGSSSEMPVSGAYRPTIMGTNGMVASGHYLATLAGERILARGGNAIDAGVAAGLASCVLHIDMVNFAGVAPIIVYLADEDRCSRSAGSGAGRRRRAWRTSRSVAAGGFRRACSGASHRARRTPGSPRSSGTAR